MQQEPVILKMADEILDICNPKKIIIFSKKYNMAQELTAFKLCVIVPDSIDTSELECRIYLELDCENPFNVILYNISEWERICVDNGSFANSIIRNGVVIYES